MLLQVAVLRGQQLARQAPPPQHDGGGQDGGVQVDVKHVYASGVVAGGDEELLIRGVVGQGQQRPRVGAAKLITLFVLGQLCKRMGHGVCDEEEDGYDGAGTAPWGCACVCICAWLIGAEAADNAPQQGSRPPWALLRYCAWRRARPHAKSRLFSGWRPCNGPSTCGGALGQRGTGAQGREG